MLFDLVMPLLGIYTKDIMRKVHKYTRTHTKKTYSSQHYAQKKKEKT